MAMSVPLSRSTLRVGGGSAFYVRRRYHESIIYHAADLRVDEFAGHLRAFSHDYRSSPWSRELSRAHDVRCRCFLCRLALSGVLVASALAGIFAKMVQAAFDGRQHFLCAGSYAFCYWLSMTATPNKSPEPTAVGAVSSAIAVHVAGRRWLSFFR